MLYDTPTSFFLIFLQWCSVSEQSHRVKKRDCLSPILLLAGLFFPMCLSSICKKPVARGWDPPWVTVPVRQ